MSLVTTELNRTVLKQWPSNEMAAWLPVLRTDRWPSSAWLPFYGNMAKTGKSLSCFNIIQVPYKQEYANQNTNQLKFLWAVHSKQSWCARWGQIIQTDTDKCWLKWPLRLFLLFWTITKKQTLNVHWSLYSWPLKGLSWVIWAWQCAASPHIRRPGSGSPWCGWCHEGARCWRVSGLSEEMLQRQNREIVN